MTYCVAMLVDTGLVFLADSRTNAGVDQVNTFRKTTVLEKPGERVLVLTAAGNLAVEVPRAEEGSLIDGLSRMVRSVRTTSDKRRWRETTSIAAFSERRSGVRLPAQRDPKENGSK